jgi:hypothetical protein
MDAFRSWRQRRRDARGETEARRTFEALGISWEQAVANAQVFCEMMRAATLDEDVTVPEGGLAAALTEIVQRPGWGTGDMGVHVVDDETGWAARLPLESARIPQGSVVTEATFGPDRRLHLRIEHGSEREEGES